MATTEPHPPIHLEDQQLISQLASLQDMHDQIHHLRILPQALLNPVSQMLRIQALPSVGSDVPSKLYARIQKIAMEGLNDVESFKQGWLNEESQALWRRTLSEPCPQGSDVWRVDYMSALRESKDREQHRALELRIPATDPRALKDIIHGFCEKHPSIKFESQDSTDLIPFNIRIAGMTFRVVPSVHGNRRDYEVQYNQDSKASQLQDGVMRHLNQRRAKGNLQFLLDMITSYQDVTKRPCDRCLKLFDKRLTFPIIRNQKSNIPREGENDARWEALHDDCA